MISLALNTNLTTSLCIEQRPSLMLFGRQDWKQLVHALNDGCVVVQEVGGRKIAHDGCQRGPTTAMVQIIQGIISADVAVPLLKRMRGLLETLKALPTSLEMLGRYGVTVKAVALIRRAPKDTHPMLTR